MSSGFGLRGGIGRCYPFWAEYKECLVRVSAAWCLRLFGCGAGGGSVSTTSTTSIRRTSVGAMH